MLPKLAAALHTTVDALLGYSSVVTDYDRRYDREEYYWGLKPNRLCYEIMKILPPIKPYRVLDIGCGEGKDAVFFAKCGYAVTAFDISEQGIEKAKKLAAYNQVEARFFKADLYDYRPDAARDEGKRNPWHSGELFGYYHDWLFHMCREEVFDCNSGGTPHKHCMDTLIAQKQTGVI